MSRTIYVLGLAAGLAVGGGTAHAGEPDASSETFFELKVRPVLAGTCVKCHGEKKASGGLRLDSREAMLAGGESGPAVVPGDPEGSPLVRAVRHADDTLKMPPNRPLPARRPGRPGRLGRRRRALAEGRRGRGRSRARRTGPSSRSGRSRRPTTRPAGPPQPIDRLIAAGHRARGCTPSRGPTAAP